MVDGREQSTSGTQITGINWKPILGYEVYEASNTGLIRRNNKCLTPVLKKNGYHEIRLSIGGRVKHLSVHRLVYSTFYPIPIGYVINHIDGNKTNNSLNNLEAVTELQNHAHSKEFRVRKGKDVNTSKLSEKEVAEIRKSKASTSELMKRYPVCRSTVNRVRARKSWNHI